MKLTTKGRYAVTAMLDLALHAKIGRVPLSDIAERQGISPAYLEQLFALLRKAKLVSSLRGPNGGYQLNKDASDISLADILFASQETIDFSCGNGSTCSEENPCLTHDLWHSLNNEFIQFLSNKNLADIIQSRHVQTLANKQDSNQIGNIPIKIYPQPNES